MKNKPVKSAGNDGAIGFPLLRRYASVALLLCLGIVLSVVFFTIVQQQEQAYIQAEFERQTNNYVAAIQSGIDRNLEVLESIGGLYAASIKVDRNEFREFVKGPLLRNGEIQALSWNKRVTHSERKQLVDTLRQEGYPEFQFKDLGPEGQRVVAAERPEYIVVIYIEPYEGNEAALGLNVASNTTRLKALERARDTGEMITTARITLVQETGEQFGFLILRPIYKNSALHETLEERRQNLTGYAVGVFRVGGMVETSLKDLPKGSINIQLEDEASPAGERILHLHQAREGNDPTDEEQLEARDGLYLRAALHIPGRQWSLLFSATPEFFAAHGTRRAWSVLGGGLLITVLLVVYIIIIINYTAKIEGLAAERLHVNKELKNEITGRKRAEDALLESERQSRKQLAELELFYRTAPLGLCHMDTDLRYWRCNEKLAEINGISPADHIGRTIREIVPEIAETMEPIYRHVIESGEPAIDIVATGATAADPQKVRHFSACYYPVKSEDGVVQGISSIVQEITERKEAEEFLRNAHEQLERRVQERTKELAEANAALKTEITERKRTKKQLVQAAKLAALGQLGAGIAHELSQPITTIQGFAQRIKRSGERQIKDHVDELDLIINATHRIGRIVDNICTFSRQSDFEAQPIDPLVPLDDALMLISEQLRLRGIEVERPAGDGLPRVIGDHVKLQQVFSNLIMNARHALDTMPKDRPRRLALGARVEGDRVVYSVEDNGPGISEEDQPRIFDPFFTTKKVGQGIGLGLSISHGIVKDHGGEIRYEPVAGGGARFLVSLPIAPVERTATVG